MNSGLRRIAGFGLIVIAAGSILLGGFGIYQIWRWRTPMIRSVNDSLTLAQDMVNTSSGMLDLVEKSLDTANSEVVILLATLTNLTTMLKETDPMLESLQSLTGESLPGALNSTRASLVTAQGSAEVIDNVLRTVSAIPFFPGDPYNPKVPLSASLKEISTSLNSMLPALASIDVSLDNTQENLASVTTDITLMTASTRQVQRNLEQAQQYVQKYKVQVTDAKNYMKSAQAAAPLWGNRIAWVGTLATALIVIAQLSLLVQGINLFRRV